MYGKLRIFQLYFPVDIGIVLDKVDKRIAEVRQGTSQCDHDGIVEMGTVIDEYVDPVAVEDFIQKFGRVDQLVVCIQFRRVVSKGAELEEVLHIPFGNGDVHIESDYTRVGKQCLM